MKKKTIIILVVAIIIFCIAVGFFVWTLNNNEEIEPENTVEVDEISKTKDIENAEYTDFTFYKEDGTEVKLSDYKDKSTMILFWNSENEDSVEVLKKVSGMYEQYKSNVNFIMINTAQEVDEKIKEEVSFEIFYDFYKEGVMKYKISEVPSMLYITEENEIINAKSGLTTTDALEANLEIISDKNNRIDNTEN